MKNVTLIIFLIGGFLLMVGIMLLSWTTRKDNREKVAAAMEKARAGKAEKAAIKKAEAEEQQRLNGTKEKAEELASQD